MLAHLFPPATSNPFDRPYIERWAGTNRDRGTGWHLRPDPRSTPSRPIAVARPPAQALRLHRGQNIVGNRRERWLSTRRMFVAVLRSEEHTSELQSR